MTAFEIAAFAVDAIRLVIDAVALYRKTLESKK